MVTYNIIRSFIDQYKEHTFTLNNLPTLIEKLNHLWQQESFKQQNICSLSLCIDTTKAGTRNNKICRYMFCSRKCDYKEKFLFDFNNNSIFVFANRIQPCQCSLLKQIKRATYNQIRTIVSLGNEKDPITPTIIQGILEKANNSGKKFCIPSKKHLQYVKQNMKRKVCIVI